MATGQEWGQALQGMGAWFAGKGPEYEAVQVANARTAQEDAILTDERRRKAMIQDITLTKSLADSGQWDKASELLQNRLMEIDRLGGDPKHTLALYESISDPARRPEAVSEMNAFIQAGIMAGEIKALPGAEEAYSSIFTTDDGRRAGLSKATGKVEILPSEDGIRARMPEGASGDAQKGSTQVVIIGGKPYLSGSVFNPQTQQWSNQIIPMEDPTGAGGSVEIANSSGLGASQRPDQAAREAGASAAAQAAIERSEKYFDRVDLARTSISNIDDAIAALDKGANTGTLTQYLPSFKQATKELDAAARRMGLDVVSSVTFGALSEGELRLAMSNALPKDMEPPELRQWLVERRDAQMKLATYLESAAIYMGTVDDEGKPHTPASWAKMQKQKREETTNNNGQPSAQGSHPSGAAPQEVQALEAAGMRWTPQGWVR
jgi:hypothetical protein